MKAKRCKDCAFSTPEIDSQGRPSHFSLQCVNENVIGRDPWTLGTLHARGVDCTKERSKRWSVCGLKGKLFIPAIGESA